MPEGTLQLCGRYFKCEDGNVQRMEILQWQRRILNIRGHRVLLDIHLAQMLSLEVAQVRGAIKTFGESKDEYKAFRLKKVEWHAVRSKCFRTPEDRRCLSAAEGYPWCITLAGLHAISKEFPSERAKDLERIWMETIVTADALELDLGAENRRMAMLEAETGWCFSDTWEVHNLWWESRRERKKPLVIGPKRINSETHIPSGVELDFE